MKVAGAAARDSHFTVFHHIQRPFFYLVFNGYERFFLIAVALRLRLNTAAKASPRAIFYSLKFRLEMLGMMILAMHAGRQSS